MQRYAWFSTPSLRSKTHCILGCDPFCPCLHVATWFRDDEDKLSSERSSSSDSYVEAPVENIQVCAWDFSLICKEN